MTRVRRSLTVGLACTVVAVGLAACGSSGDDSSSSGSGTPGEQSASRSFTYGYSVPTGQNPFLSRIVSGVEETAGAAGGEMELGDAQLDPGRAVQQITRFISSGVSSITVGPAQVPEAVTGILNGAAAKGIDVFALEWSFDEDRSAPPKAPVKGQAIVDRGKIGDDVAKAVNEGAGDKAKIIYIGLPFPVPSLDFFEQHLKAGLGSSEIVADVDNPKDNAQAALGPLNGALAAHPEANAIVTYNGPSALAAVQAVKAAGMEGKVKIYDIQIEKASAAALKAGQIEAIWDLNPPALGEALGGLIAAAGSGKPESEWAKTVVVEAPMYTQENIDTWEDWTVGG